MGVGGCETKTIGYTCRSVALKVFGPGFNSRRLHQTRPSVTLPRGPLLSVERSHWHCGSRETSQHKFFSYQYPVLAKSGRFLTGFKRSRLQAKPTLLWEQSCMALTATLDASFVLTILATLNGIKRVIESSCHWR